MTETAAVTVSDFISTVLVAGVAVVVIVQITTNQIMGTDSGVDMSAVQELESKISRVCQGEQDTAPGEVSMSSGTTIVLEGRNMRIEGVDPEQAGDIETERELPCPIESREVLENTELYTVTRSGGSYDLR